MRMNENRQNNFTAIASASRFVAGRSQRYFSDGAVVTFYPPMIPSNSSRRRSGALLFGGSVTTEMAGSSFPDNDEIYGPVTTVSAASAPAAKAATSSCRTCIQAIRPRRRRLSLSPLRLSPVSPQMCSTPASEEMTLVRDRTPAVRRDGIVMLRKLLIGTKLTFISPHYPRSPTLPYTALISSP